MNSTAAAVGRVVLATSGALASFSTLLPAAIAGLIALFDVSAHGLLGMSGTLLALASPFDGGNGGMPGYRGINVDLRRAALLSVLRGLSPIGMIVLAIVPNGMDGRFRWIGAAGLSAASCLMAGWLALPGLLAAFALAWSAVGDGALSRTPPGPSRDSVLRTTPPDPHRFSK